MSRRLLFIAISLATATLSLADDGKLDMHALSPFTQLLMIIVILMTVGAVITFFLYKKQQEILKSSARYYALINNAPFNYNRSKLLFDTNGNVVDLITEQINLTLQNSARKNNAQIGNKTVMVSYPESAPELIRHINEARKEKKKTTRFTYHLKEYDCYYEMLILLDNTDTIHIFSLNTTEQMNTQKELEIAKEKVEQSDMAKASFVQNVSHEVRTPLNAVVGFSQLLAQPNDALTQEEREKYVEYIQNNSEMLTMLVNDILAVSDIERDGLPVELSDVSCNSVCKKALRTVESRVPEGVKMHFTTEVADDFMIHSDSKRIQQVIFNFLTNACKHTEKGEILIHCSSSENEGKVTFSVTDTGEGIPSEMAEKIFERFTKLDTFKQGAGLGLNICRTIADKLNGEVKLDTTYTNGARFLFILPVEE